MGTARCERPNFSEQAQRCISVAKGIAMKETADARLDSLHVILAAIREVPQAARSIFEKAGYQWLDVQNACPEPNASALGTVDQRQMALVGPLKEVVAKLQPAGNHDDENNPPKVEVEEFLSLTLGKPSTRLREFLRRIRKNTASESKAPPKRPFGSFREYLAAKKEIWMLRRTACNLDETYTRKNSTRNHASADQKRRDAALDKAANLEGHAAQRVKASKPQILPLREIAAEHNLSLFETELLEGLLVHELYGCLGFPDAPLCVRELAQLMGPEIFPQNCRTVLQALTNLVGAEMAEVNRADGEPYTLSARVRPTPSFQDTIFSYLDTDVINDADVAAARRWLNSSVGWPV